MSFFRSTRASSSHRQVVVAVFAVAAVVVVAGCGSAPRGNESKAPAVLVINSQVTEAAPVMFSSGDLSAKFWYDVSPNVVDSNMKPLVRWAISVPAGQLRTLRADVRLTLAGKQVDAYFPVDYTASAKNEVLINDLTYPRSSSFNGQKTGPVREGFIEDWSSPTGEDFEFTLSHITVAPYEVTPSTAVGTPEPTFDATTPAGKFNQLAAQKGWTAPRGSEPDRGDDDYQQDPSKRPAAAVQRFIRQILAVENDVNSTLSPAQTFQSDAKKWNAQMLAAGIDILGGPRIKEISRQVTAGDIERWFMGSGTYVVGDGPDQIPPGTYRTTGSGQLITDGYWERTSISGEIVDNQFVTSAQSVTVTISAGDGQFTTRRMGTWKPVK